MADEELTQWADHKIVWIKKWAILYLTIYCAFSVVSWIIAIIVPFALAIMLYIPEAQRHNLNIAILATSCLGLCLLVVANILRLKERSFRGQRLAATLEAALIKYRAGLMETATFVKAIEYFLKEGYQEEGP